LVRDNERAEDLVQETWASWVERGPKGVREPRAWLARVLRNRAFNLKRSDERRAARETLAGIPDASAPETDGTLEAQAQLLEALRALEEPFRSALVQRYYHDLTPSAIAERNGTPLNTVKARLARGLERLRVEMDRRYHGDRRAWCHWLTVLNSPPVVSVPIAPEPASAPPPTIVVASNGSLLGWLGVALAIAAVTAWKGGWVRGRDPRERPPAEVGAKTAAEEPQRRAGVSEESPHKTDSQNPLPTSRAAAASKPSRPVASQVLPEAPTRMSAPGIQRFDWPQFGGWPDHATRAAVEERIQHTPKVAWFVPGCSGQPTLLNGELYTGGLTVARLDPETGEILNLLLEPILEVLELDFEWQRTLAIPSEVPQLQERISSAKNALEILTKLESFDPNDPKFRMVLPAPAVTPGRVFVRWSRTGGVTAFNRRLDQSLWSWEPEEWSSDDRPLSLAAEGRLLVLRGDSLTALRESDGLELWSREVFGRIAAVPASADGRVFITTENGALIALATEKGNRLWEAQTSGFGKQPPIVLGGSRVLVVGKRPYPNNERICVYDAASGDLLWDLEGNVDPSPIGVSAGGEVVGYRPGAFESVDLVRRVWGGGPRLEVGVGSPKEFSEPPAVFDETFVVAAGRTVRGRKRGEVSRDYVAAHDWSFYFPGDIQSFVHAGSQIFVATSVGLFCLVDEPPQPDAVFINNRFDGDPRVPVFADRDK
jgi:RNA polymerase sigma-70 factor (ECF subfamily)